MPESEFTNSNGVRAFFGGRSKAWLWRLRRDDSRFPKPIFFGNQNPHWRIADLKAYAARCEADSKNHAA